MATFLISIGLIVLFIIGKFIYDSYLTNNTERDWQDYIISSSTETNVLGRNKGFNFRPNYNVRIDGLYVFRHEGVSPYGRQYKLTMILMFNKHNRVVKDDTDGFPKIEKNSICKLIQDFSDCTELSQYCTDVIYKDGKISMKFMNSSTQGEEYSGSVIKDGLLLTRILHYWDETLQRPNTKVSLTDMKFDFIKAE